MVTSPVALSELVLLPLPVALADLAALSVADLSREYMVFFASIELGQNAVPVALIVEIGQHMDREFFSILPVHKAPYRVPGSTVRITQPPHDFGDAAIKYQGRHYFDSRLARDNVVDRQSTQRPRQ